MAVQETSYIRADDIRTNADDDALDPVFEGHTLPPNEEVR